jgi:glutamine amidotransferase
MIAVVDYGAGNIQSVLNMLRSLNLPAKIAATGDDFVDAERIILPGVGHYDHGMKELEARSLIEPLNRKVMEQRTPLLGICLGAQLITRTSEEGKRPGLGWISGDVVAFDRSRIDQALRLPHMGWSETWVADRGILPKAFENAFPENAQFYYVHGFHLVCDEPEQAFLRSWYGYEFAAGVIQGNVIGMQFHPEKSHEFGKQVLRAFAAWNPTLGDS